MINHLPRLHHLEALSHIITTKCNISLGYIHKGYTRKILSMLICVFLHIITFLLLPTIILGTRIPVSKHQNGIGTKINIQLEAKGSHHCETL